MRENGELIFDAGRTTWLWVSDKNDRTHPTMRYTLDHEIDGEQLAKAWEKTLRVYPILTCAVNGDSGYLRFYRSDEESRVIHTPSPVCPCTKLAAFKPAALSYDGNTLTVTAYHSVMDGSGMIGVVKTLIYEYCSIHFKKEFDPAGIMLKEGRDPSEYYKTQNNVDLGSFTPAPLVLQPEGEEIFTDPEMKVSAGNAIFQTALRIPAQAFMAECRASGATPAVMLCMLFARAVYHMDESERRRMSFVLTLDQRSALGLKDTLGQCSASALIGASYEELMQGDPQSAAVRLREQLDHQRSADYIKTYITLARTYDILYRDVSAVISYEGRLDFGECGGHVVGMSLVNNSSNTLHMLELNGSFLLTLQFGDATQRYAEALQKELRCAGIEPESLSPVGAAIKEIRSLEQ